jgi:hypothetical protein
MTGYDHSDIDSACKKLYSRYEKIMAKKHTKKPVQKEPLAEVVPKSVKAKSKHVYQFNKKGGA